MLGFAPPKLRSATEIGRVSGGEVAELLKSKDARMDTLMQQVVGLERQVGWVTRKHLGCTEQRFGAPPDPAQRQEEPGRRSAPAPADAFPAPGEDLLLRVDQPQVRAS